MTLNQTSVSLDDAQRVVAAGRAKADEISSPSNIAVVDVGGNLVTHIRMDGAWIGSVDISINKAFTARAFDISTEELAADAGPGGQFYGIHASNGGRVMIFAGGIPLQPSRRDSGRRRRQRRERQTGPDCRRSRRRCPLTMHPHTAEGSQAQRRHTVTSMAIWEERCESRRAPLILLPPTLHQGRRSVRISVTHA